MVDVYAPKWVEREWRLLGYPDFSHWAGPGFHLCLTCLPNVPSILVAMSKRGNVISRTF